MHRPVCVKCEVELRPKKNGVGLLDYADFGEYQIWDADLWECPRCNYQIVIGFGHSPIDIHNTDSFSATVECYKQKSKVIENREASQ